MLVKIIGRSNIIETICITYKSKKLKSKYVNTDMVVAQNDIVAVAATACTFSKGAGHYFLRGSNYFLL